MPRKIYPLPSFDILRGFFLALKASTFSVLHVSALKAPTFSECVQSALKAQFYSSISSESAHLLSLISSVSPLLFTLAGHIHSHSICEYPREGILSRLFIGRDHDRPF